MKNSLAIALTLALALAVQAAGGSVAQATPPDPAVEVIIPGQQPPEPPEPFFEEEDGRAVGTFAAWGSGFRLSDLRFTLGEDAEIEGVNGTRVQVPDRANVGGLTYGLGYRPLPWLRLPEIRIRMGAGSAPGPWHALAGSPGLEARSTRFFTGAADLVVGVQVPLGRVTPFLRGYATAGFATLRAEVRHPELGGLGSERSTRGYVGAGVEAGFIVHFHEALGLTFGYRHGLYGPETSAAFLGLAILGDD